MTGNRLEMIGGWTIFVAIVFSTTGLAFDVQWHADVGPDTFFTAPHLMIYIGMALGGLASLAVVLTRTFRATAEVSGGRAVTVFGVFRAPVGFLVAGIGAALGLLYGLGDLWWHSFYGFDATATSPPHIGLTLADATQVVGGILVFSALREHRAGRLGMAAVTGVGLTNLLFLSASIPGSGAVTLFVTGLVLLVLVLVAGVTRSVGWVALAGLILLMVQAFEFFWTPWITAAYADVVGLPVREFNPLAGFPILAFSYPVAALPVALVLAGGLAIGRRAGWSPQLAAPAAGAVAAVLLAGTYEFQITQQVSPTVLLLAVPVGAAVGWLGWRLAAPLRQLAPPVPQGA